MGWTALALAATALIVGGNLGFSSVTDAQVATKAAVTCGGTPGFCPNPPAASEWPTGTGGDF